MVHEPEILTQRRADAFFQARGPYRRLTLI